MPRTASPSAAALHWVAVLVLVASLLAMAVVPGAPGLAAAAVLWIIGFVLFEATKRRPVG